MIVISLDESGSFEGKGGAIRLIGGLIYREYESQEKNYNQIYLEEKQRVEDYLKKVCIEIGLKYPKGIHGIDIKDVQKKYKLKEAVKKYINESGNYYFTSIIKSKVDKKSYSNNSILIDDKYASNLYERMSASLINNILFYNPIFKSETNINFEIATRSIPIENDNLEEINKYKKLGYRYTSSYNIKKKKEETWFYLTNQQTFKVATSTKMVEDKINTNINAEYNVDSINYHRSLNDKNRETTPFLYLADLACDILREYINVSRLDFNISKLSEEIEKISGNNSLIWVYDDIDDNYAEIYENIDNNKYIEALEGLYKFENSKSNFKRFYSNKWLYNVYEKINSIFKNESLSLYVDEVDRYLGKSTSHSRDNVKDINLGIYIGENILKNIEKNNIINPILKYKIIDQLLMAYNQRGNIEKAKEMFNICNELKWIVGEESFCGTCLNLAQTFCNEFDFDSSIMCMENALNVVIKKKENINFNIYNIFENRKLNEKFEDNSKIIMLGKIYSSLGQFNSFKGDYREAFKYFKLALDEFKYDNFNFKFTTSLLLHLLIEMDDKISYEEYCLQYFEGENIEEQLNYVIKQKNRFSLYILVKAIVRFNLEINDNTIEVLKTIILNDDEMWIKDSNPWQIIYKYLSILFLNKGKKDISDICIKKIGYVVKDKERELTLHIIALFNEIEARYLIDLNHIEAKRKIDELKHMVNSNISIKNYLWECFKLDSIDIVIKLLKDKLRFTYS